MSDFKPDDFPRMDEPTSIGCAFFLIFGIAFMSLGLGIIFTWLILR